MRSPAPPGGHQGDSVRSVIEAVRGGDREAFASIVEGYQGRLYALALMMTRDPTGAEEVTQDAFVRAYTCLDRYDERRPLYPWLATIATRLAQSWLRRRARSETREAGAPSELLASPDIDPLGEIVSDETSRRVWEAVAELPSGERTAVFMYYKDEMKVTEIAAVLGVTSGTIKTLLFRARRRLRRAFVKVSEPSHEEVSR